MVDVRWASRKAEVSDARLIAARALAAFAALSESDKADGVSLRRCGVCTSIAHTGLTPAVDVGDTCDAFRAALAELVRRMSLIRALHDRGVLELVCS